MKSSLYAPLALTAALCAATPAHAQQAGQWLFRGGVMSIIPDVTSDDLSAPTVPGAKIDVESATTVAGGISYMVTDNWSVDLPLAWPLKHHIKGAGSIAGSGEIGTTKVAPATLFAQYRFFEAQAQVRPYVGLGLTYAIFFDETANGTLTALTNPGGTPTTMKIKDHFGLTPQVGLTYAVNDKVFVEGMVAKSLLKTTTTLSTGQSIETKLNPWTLGLYVGWKY